LRSIAVHPATSIILFELTVFAFTVGIDLGRLLKTGIAFFNTQIRSGF